MKNIFKKIEWCLDYYVGYFFYNGQKMYRYDDYMSKKWGNKYEIIPDQETNPDKLSSRTEDKISKLIKNALERSSKYNLQDEVMTSAMYELKENPGMSIEQAIDNALHDWDL